MRLTRRGLIRSIILALGAGPAHVLRPLPGRARGMLARLEGETGAAPAAAGLSGSELDDLIAFAELLVEGRTLSSVERGHLVANVEERVAREPDYLALYRTTVVVLQRLAGRRFAALDIGERIELVTRHRLISVDVRPGEDFGPFPDDIRLVRTRALRDLIADYYASPAGWAVVGYDPFPGKCGDLARYTRPES